MKRITQILILALLIIGPASYAQTSNEWFRQKKTQKQYLVEQIAALHVYLDYVKQGYSIARKGLNTIENIKNGHFALDRDFFSSLKNVNPAVRNTAKVADIIAFQIFISKEFGRTYKYCATNSSFSPEEVRYVAEVHSNLLFLTDASVSEFISIIKTSDVKMTDDERINRLDHIYNDLNEKCAFVIGFSNDVRLLSLQRDRSHRDIEALRAQVLSKRLS